MPPKKNNNNNNKAAAATKKKPKPEKKPKQKQQQNNTKKKPIAKKSNNNNSKNSSSEKKKQSKKSTGKSRGRPLGSKNKIKKSNDNNNKKKKNNKLTIEELESFLHGAGASSKIQNFLDNNEECTPVEGKDYLLKLHQLLMSVPDKDKLLAFSISPGALKTYLGYKKMVTSRVSFRTKQNFLFTTDGLTDFILDPLVSDDIATVTCTSIVSAFKFLYKLDYCTTITTRDETKLEMAINARKHLVPDHTRITGAVNRTRTLEFCDFVDKQEDLTAEEKQQFKDLAITLYAGCLRVFQSRSLSLASFTEDINKKGVFWVQVPKKGKQSELETKILDKQLGKNLMEIVNRRAVGKGREDFLFADITKAVENKFAKYCEKASIELKWPSGMHFKGTHMFRHGAVQDAAVEDGLEFAQTRSGHESDKCLRHYARSDSQRKIAMEKRKTKNREIEEYTTQIVNKAREKYQQSAEAHNIDLVEQRPLGRDVLALADNEHKSRMNKLRCLVSNDQQFSFGLDADDADDEVTLDDDGNTIAVNGTDLLPNTKFTDMPDPESQESKDELRQDMCRFFNIIQQQYANLTMQLQNKPATTTTTSSSSTSNVKCSRCPKLKRVSMRWKKVALKRRRLNEKLKIQHRLKIQQQQATINRLVAKLRERKAKKEVTTTKSTPKQTRRESLDAYFKQDL